MHRKIFILDTSVLLYDKNSIHSFKNNDVVLPIVVLDELDRKKEAPGILGESARYVNRFLDDLRSQGSLTEGVTLPNNQTIKVELDGFDNSSSVIVMGATNRPDVLDSALLRPGRFDRQVVVDVPDLNGRHDILKIHTKKIKMKPKSVKLLDIAKGTPGMVGADLANLVNEAALLASRKRKATVDNSDFQEAQDKVLMGVQRKSMVLSDHEKKVTAYHEAGHAVVALFSPEADPVHKVTIIPRGRALGVTMQLPIDEKHGYSKTYILSRLAVMMGGRAAEDLILNEITTGASNDIERATSIARRMVCEWGMSDKMGPMAFGKKNEEIFLGREIQSHRDYSEETAQMIDHEVVSIIKNAQDTARKILEDNIDLLHLMAEELLEHETIDESDIKVMMSGKKISKK